MGEKTTVIVVSGPPGSGSTSVAKEVAKKLGYRLLVPGYQQKALVDTKEENKAALESWSTEVGANKDTHVDRDNMQVEEAKKGNIVLCGKLSIHFLKDLSDCKVWLDVPLEVRAKRTAKRDGVSVDDAMRQVEERENIERERWKEMYGFDYFYQKDVADLVIDSSELTLEQTVKQILDFINS